MSAHAHRATLVALLVLLAGSVAVSRLALAAPAALAAGLSIAATKAALIGLVFMRLGRAPDRIWLVVIAGLFWAMVLGAILDDYLTR